MFCNRWCERITWRIKKLEQLRNGICFIWKDFHIKLFGCVSRQTKWPLTTSYGSEKNSSLERSHIFFSHLMIVRVTTWTANPWEWLYRCKNRPPIENYSLYRGRDVHGDVLALWWWGLRVKSLLPTVHFWLWATRKGYSLAWQRVEGDFEVVKIHLVG